MRVGLCLEQTLGHRAHAANLERTLSDGQSDVDIVHVEFGEPGRVPWAFRGSWQAARKLRARPRHDVRFFHTQSVSLFAPLIASGRPYVVSVDATPAQIDAMGQWYRHRRQAGVAERLKARWYRSVLGRASAVVSWSEWAAESLVAEYGVPQSRIAVVHPGAPRSFFEIDRAAGRERPVVLFVGGDLPRKGGDLLLEAMTRLAGRAHLIMVTPDHVEAGPDIEVVAGATPGSAALVDAYRRADIFCLPTRGDCTPLVLGEAMAAGLPVVSTSIGSNSETVRQGVDGLLVPPGDASALADALEALIDDPAGRAAMGANARQRAEELFDAERNAFKILALLEAVAR